MITANSPEIFWLVLTVIITALFWIPQIVNSIVSAGPKMAFFYPDNATAYYAEWANRSKSAHNNAVENLIIFAPLVLLVVLFDIGNEWTRIASLVYFLARLVHYIMHVLAIPLMRTLAFLVGFGCQLVVGICILIAI